MKKINLTIITPEKATTNTENKLVELTRQLRLKTGEKTGYGLGGKDGYGIEYENEVFMMHPYCWCDKKSCQWCYGDAPNFLYKPTNTKIYWYKWIGRSQKQKGSLPPDWFEKCVESIWDKNDCWYDIDQFDDVLEESFTGIKKPLTIHLNFNVSDKDAYVKVKLSPFAENNIKYWTMDEILADISVFELNKKETKKIIELDKKYPCLREKIKLDVINHCKKEIKWLQKILKRINKNNG